MARAKRRRAALLSAVAPTSAACASTTRTRWPLPRRCTWCATAWAATPQGKWPRKSRWTSSRPRAGHPDASALGQAVEEANLAIIRAAREGVGRARHGTHLTAAMLEKRQARHRPGGRLARVPFAQGQAAAAHPRPLPVADMIEAGQLTPEEARVHPQRSVITRALGSDPRTSTRTCSR